MTTKAIVLLSGGIDSATVLWMVKGKWNSIALTFKFGKTNKKEMEAARKIAKKAGVRQMVVDMPFLKQMSELRKFRKNPILKKFKIPMTYIPSRNTIFFGVASYFAELLGVNYIVTGHSFIDPFPDTKVNYVKSINSALSNGSWLGKRYKIKVVMPLAKLDKTHITKLATKLKVPLELTWSCYKNGKVACGKCDGCINNLVAFKK